MPTLSLHFQRHPQECGRRRLSTLIYSTVFYLTALLISTTASSPALAEGTAAYDKAHLAVSNILFDYEEPGYEFASFRIDDDGLVNIIFAVNMPDALYGEILTKLQQHPDIYEVFASQGGPVCSLW